MPTDTGSLIDRDEERARLRDLLATGVPQLVLMYGRRRVGKTFLLNRIWGDAPAFYFTAAETTPAQNRVALLVAFAEWSGQPLPIEDYPDLAECLPAPDRVSVASPFCHHTRRIPVSGRG